MIDESLFFAGRYFCKLDFTFSTDQESRSMKKAVD